MKYFRENELSQICNELTEIKALAEIIKRQQQEKQKIEKNEIDSCANRIISKSEYCIKALRNK